MEASERRGGGVNLFLGGPNLVRNTIWLESARFTQMDAANSLVL